VAGGQLDVAPVEREDLADAQTSVGAEQEQGLVERRGFPEKIDEFLVGVGLDLVPGSVGGRD